jgi:hypothetical protein
MANRLYMDVHVPSAVTDALRRRGVDVVTSQDDGTRELDDKALLARATELGRVLFSQDDDLLAIAAGWQSGGNHFPGLVYAHQQGPGIGQLIEDLELLLLCFEPAELTNCVIHLPLK